LANLSTLARIRIQLRRGLTTTLVLTTGYFISRGMLTYCRNIDLFELRRVEVRGNNILTRAEVIKAMEVPITGSLFDVDLRRIQRKMETLQYIYGVRLGRQLPHTIFIDVVENEPLAYVAAPEFFILSCEGEALPLPHGQLELELPTITGLDGAADALKAGGVTNHQQLNQAWEILLHIMDRYPGIYLELSELVFGDDNEVTLYIADNSTAVRLGNQKIEQRIAMLDAFLLTVKGKRTLMDYSYIDLRYDKQIIVRERV